MEICYHGTKYSVFSLETTQHLLLTTKLITFLISQNEWRKNCAKYIVKYLQSSYA